MSKDNPRFPHQCVIYRRKGANSFNPKGEVVELYSGPCHKQASSNDRVFTEGSNTNGKVEVSTYRISMPGIVKGIQKGDLIDVTDLIGTEKGMRISFFDATRLMGGGTSVTCKIPSN